MILTMASSKANSTLRISGKGKATFCKLLRTHCKMPGNSSLSALNNAKRTLLFEIHYAIYNFLSKIMIKRASRNIMGSFNGIELPQRKIDHRLRIAAWSKKNQIFENIS